MVRYTTPAGDQSHADILYARLARGLCNLKAGHNADPHAREQVHVISMLWTGDHSNIVTRDASPEVDGAK